MKLTGQKNVGSYQEFVFGICHAHKYTITLNLYLAVVKLQTGIFIKDVLTIYMKKSGKNTSIKGYLKFLDVKTVW